MGIKKSDEEQAYTEILDVLKKHKEICVYDVNEMELSAKKHLFGIELKEKHGFNIEPRSIKSLDWNNFSDYISIGLWGEKYNRTIASPDDRRQPEDELLLRLTFPGGPYIFGNYSDNDYPIELFKKFFEELKAYNPKYTDTVNKSLYFSVENAGKIFNEFPAILKKYYELKKIDARERKIEKLKAELVKLETK